MRARGSTGVLLIGTAMLALLAVPAASGPTPGDVRARAVLLQLLNDLSADLSALEKTYERHRAAAESVAALHARLGRKVEEVANLTETARRAPRRDAAAVEDLFAAVRQMQELQVSFNLQYLQLQNQMQNENRQFMMLSNIMKAKHDTAKNAISNIR